MREGLAVLPAAPAASDRPRPGGLSGEHMADDPPARPRVWPGSLRRGGLDLRPFCVAAGRVRGRSRRGRRRLENRGPPTRKLAPFRCFLARAEHAFVWPGPILASDLTTKQVSVQPLAGTRRVAPKFGGMERAEAEAI